MSLLNQIVWRFFLLKYFICSKSVWTVVFICISYFRVKLKWKLSLSKYSLTFLPRYIIFTIVYLNLYHCPLTKHNFFIYHFTNSTITCPFSKWYSKQFYFTFILQSKLHKIKIIITNHCQIIKTFFNNTCINISANKKA